MQQCYVLSKEALQDNYLLSLWSIKLRICYYVNYLREKVRIKKSVWSGLTLVFIMQACGKRSEVSEKFFSCSMCNFSSNYLYSLKRHMATHCSYNLSTSLPSDQQPPPSSIDLIKEPTLICMQKPYRSSNLSFHQWVQTPGNIYIGGNAKKVLPSRVQRGLCVDQPKALATSYLWWYHSCRVFKTEEHTIPSMQLSPRSQSYQIERF